MASAGLVIATRQLADLLAGGIPLARSLDIVANQSRDAKRRRLFQGLRRDVEAGVSLSEALAARSETFSPLFIGLVRAGESTGALDKSFEEIAHQLEIENELRQRARNALVYPCLVLALAAAVCLFLTGFVIPRFQLLFDDLGQNLPLPTRLLLEFSSGVRIYGAFAILVGAAILMVVPRAAAGPFRRALDSALSWGPIRDQLIPRFAERWAHIMASLARHGFPVVEALVLTRRSLEPHPLAARLQPLETGVANGLSLSQAIRGQAMFPLIVAELIAAGEEAGRLDEALERVAATLGRESEATLRLAMTFMEPALILVMALVVGFVAIAMLLPIFEMSANVR